MKQWDRLQGQRDHAVRECERLREQLRAVERENERLTEELLATMALRAEVLRLREAVLAGRTPA